MIETKGRGQRGRQGGNVKEEKEKKRRGIGERRRRKRRRKKRKEKKGGRRDINADLRTQKHKGKGWRCTYSAWHSAKHGEVEEGTRGDGVGPFLRIKKGRVPKGRVPGWRRTLCSKVLNTEKRPKKYTTESGGVV